MAIAEEAVHALSEARVRDPFSILGCHREADGRSIDDLVAERDRGVIAVLRALGRA